MRTCHSFKVKVPKRTSGETSTQGATGVCPLPSARPPNHECSGPPRQGCASLGSTERLLCSGSWSPDALIETPCPCRNQRGGEARAREGMQTHLASAKPAHEHSYHHEINAQDMLLTNVRLLAAHTEQVIIYIKKHTSLQLLG